jgi:hypothetical protein
MTYQVLDQLKELSLSILADPLGRKALIVLAGALLTYKWTAWDA